MAKPYLSLVIPARDEQDNITILYQEITAATKDLGKDYEIIFIDDGSKDDTFINLKKINDSDKRVKVIRLRGNFGKSVALQVGFKHSLGEVIITLDSDLQDDPGEIPLFLSQIEKGFDLVNGWKKNRRDPSFSKVIPSRIINLLTKALTGVNLHDINCGFKAYRKEVTDNLNLYGELYRFIPIIAAKQNFLVSEIAVNHRARKYGKSKYGWGRGIKGILDLLTVFFITGFTKRPGHFFGTLGLLSFFMGFLIGLYITYLRLTTGTIQFRQPLLFLGMLLMIIGIQLISTGLLAEMIVYSNKKIDYTSAIKEII